MNVPAQTVQFEITDLQPTFLDYIQSQKDENTRTFNIQFLFEGDVLSLSGCTATATVTINNIMVDQELACEVNETNNYVTVVVNAPYSGVMAVQVTLTDGTNTLTMPRPLFVKVARDIAETAQIDDNTHGSFAEVVREVADARGNYATLAQAINAKEVKSNKKTTLTGNESSNDFYPTTKAVADALNTKVSSLSNRLALHISVGFNANGVPVKFVGGTTISSGAFTNSDVTKIFISQDVQTISNGAFAGCPALSDIYFDSTSTNYDNSTIPSGVTAHTLDNYHIMNCILDCVKYLDDDNKVIAKEVGELKSALTKNKQDDLFNENRINDFFGIKLQIEEGSLNISTGAEGTTENRTRCNFVELNVGDIITSTVSFFVLKYNSDLTFNSTVASNTTSYTIASNGYYRIMFTTGSVVTAEQSVSIDRNTSDCTIDYVDLENSRLNDFLGVGLLIEQGGLSVSDGSERSNNTRTRSEFIVLKKGDVITSSIAFYVIKYNDDYSYDDTVASNVKSYQVASAGKYRILLLTGNVDSAVSAIHIERNTDILTLQTIDKKLNPVRLDIPLVNPSATGMNQFSYDESFDHTNPIDIYYVSETSEYCEIYTTDFNIENKKVTSSKTVIMAPDGDDSNDGVTVPVKTISKAIELNADTIFMKEGIYWLGKNIPINTVISRDVNIIGENDNVTIFFGTESAKKIVPSQTIRFTGKLYCQGITFIGGIGVRAYTGENVCAFYRCKFLYSCGLGLQFMGKTAYLVDCEASYNHLDGLNYHQYSASVKPTGIVEVNCYGKNNGNIKNRSSNGSTVHDNGCIIRLNCIYENCHGGIIADASSKSYNFGVKAFGSTNHIVDEEWFNAAFHALAGTKMWIYNGIGNGCKYVLSSTGGSEILTDAIYDPAYIKVDSSSSVAVLS